MGCDIHTFVEVQKNGKWEAVPNPAGCKPCWMGEDGWELYGLYSGWVYEDRNYTLFSALAGVRNRYGVTPFGYPRGIPDDASPQVREYFIEDEEACDLHSCSYYYLWELYSFDWSVRLPDGERLCDCCGYFLDESIPTMGRLGESDNVRLVFGFDN